MLGPLMWLRVVLGRRPPKGSPTRVKATSAERSWVTGLARKVAVLELGLRNISVAQAVMVWVPPARPATLKVRGAQKKCSEVLQCASQTKSSALMRGTTRTDRRQAQWEPVRWRRPRSQRACPPGS